MFENYHGEDNYQKRNWRDRVVNASLEMFPNGIHKSQLYVCLGATFGSGNAPNGIIPTSEPGKVIASGLATPSQIRSIDKRYGKVAFNNRHAKEVISISGAAQHVLKTLAKTHDIGVASMDMMGMANNEKSSIIPATEIMETMNQQYCKGVLIFNFCKTSPYSHRLKKSVVEYLKENEQFAHALRVRPSSYSLWSVFDSWEYISNKVVMETVVFHKNINPEAYAFRKKKGLDTTNPIKTPKLASSHSWSRKKKYSDKLLLSIIEKLKGGSTITEECRKRGLNFGSIYGALHHRPSLAKYFS